ncbi:fructose PTS transporter subunit IIA [Tetragenococcus solitarius]|uniref:Fructose PTS transporter subunit IIA n=1 Tax=Tetragenococcus solitarius TaxID=71453 RepID=A0ABN3YCH5_9ENTE|nr:fructose PTS transporter subunit IIA [Tetragenococcus solitarius]
MQQYIKEENIFLNQDLTTRDEVFEFLAEQAVKAGIATDEKAVYQKFNEREQESTTGMMDGFAIPHAKDELIKEAEVIIVYPHAGIEWNSMDGSLSKYIIALFVPDTEAGTTHLSLLSTLARLLMKADVTDKLKNATSASEIADVLNSNIAQS